MDPLLGPLDTLGTVSSMVLGESDCCLYGLAISCGMTLAKLSL